MGKLILIAVLLVSISSCAQNGHKTQTDLAVNNDSVSYIKKCISFIKEVEKEELSNASFILSDRPSPFDYFDCFKDLLTDTADYTKDELRYIKKQEYTSVARWKAEYFGNIKMVSNDTIQAIFNKRSDGWAYFYKNIGHGFNTFSVPIFLRNDTYCLFYADNHCGWLCGGGKLTLYKKEQGKWIEVRSYCNWIS